MKWYRSVMCTGVLGLCTVLALSSCRRSSDAKSEGATDVNQATDGTQPEDVGSRSSSESVAGETPKTSGWTIEAADVQGITGVAYDTSSQPADFPNIKHWKFRLSAQYVSLLIATGDTATERMNNGKLNKHSVISGFRAEAIWEPIQGRLTVLDGGRCAEVVVSKSHGEEAKRLDFAKALATLLFDKR